MPNIFEEHIQLMDEIDKLHNLIQENLDKGNELLDEVERVPAWRIGKQTKLLKQVVEIRNQNSTYLHMSQNLLDRAKKIDLEKVAAKK